MGVGGAWALFCIIIMTLLYLVEPCDGVVAGGAMKFGNVCMQSEMKCVMHGGVFWDEFSYLWMNNSHVLRKQLPT